MKMNPPILALSGLTLDAIQAEATRAHLKHGEFSMLGSNYSAAEEEAAWAEMVKWHDGRCAICRKPARLVIDHCHRCTLIRGLLCPYCNAEPEGLPGLEYYRHDPPAARFGVQVVYAGRGTDGYAARPDLSYPPCGLCPV